MSNDDCNWDDRYEFAFINLMKLKLNKKKLTEKEYFEYFNKNKDKCSLEWPKVKYCEGVEIPETAGMMLLNDIVYMWRNKIKLPEAIEYYVYEALGSVANGEYSFEDAFFLNYKKKKQAVEHIKSYRRAINYIYTRISILLTLNKSLTNLDEVINYKDWGESGFYQEIAEELTFIFKQEMYSNNTDDEETKKHFDCSVGHVKKIIRNENFNIHKFVPLIDGSWDDGIYRENIEIYKSYLETRKEKKYSYRPVKKEDAEKRLKDLCLIEEYLNEMQENLNKNRSIQPLENWLELKSHTK